MKLLFHKLASNNFSKYLSVGALSYLIVTTITVTLHEIFGITKSSSFAFGLIVVFIINFIILRVFVFKSEGPAGFAVIKFFLASIFFRGFEYALFIVIFNLGVYYIISLTISMVVSVVLKYFVYKNIVYN